MTSLPFREWPSALVVFSDEASIPWLRLLKPGFRHCFVVLGSEAGWLAIDPLSNRTIVSPLPWGADFDLAGHFRRQGRTVIETAPRIPPRRCAPWRPYTCVESVKRILGIHAPAVLTPWRLHQFLSNEGKKPLTDVGA